MSETETNRMQSVKNEEMKTMQEKMTNTEEVKQKIIELKIKGTEKKRRE